MIKIIATLKALIEVVPEILDAIKAYLKRRKDAQIERAVGKAAESGDAADLNSVTNELRKPK